MHASESWQFKGAIPPKLVASVGDGQCTLFAGAGLSTPTFPDWADLMDWMLEQAKKCGCPTEGVCAFSADDDPYDRAGKVVRLLGRPAVNDLLLEKFQPPATPAVTQKHRTIASMQFSGVVTTNFDRLLEAAYQNAEIHPFTATSRSPSALGTLLSLKRPWVLHAHGEPTDPASIVFTREDVESLTEKNEAFRDFMKALFLNRVVLFVGYSLRDPWPPYIRRRMAQVFEGQYPPCFLLASDIDRATQESWLHDLNLVVIPYHRGQAELEHPQVTAFFRELARLAGVQLPPQATPQKAPVASRHARSTSVYVWPPSQTVAPGRAFTVEVRTRPGAPIAGAQFSMRFDPRLVQASSVAEGALLRAGGAKTLFAAGTINNNRGTVTNVYGFILSPAAKVASPGTFATIELAAKDLLGASAIDLSDVVVGDPAGHAVPIAVTHGEVTIQYG